MFVRRTLACLACAAASALPAVAAAQGPDGASRASGFSSVIGVWPVRGHLGLSLGHSRQEISYVGLVGRTQASESLGFFGHIGTAYARPETSTLGAAAAPPGSDPGYGLSYGAGVSWAFSPRGSATFRLDTQEMRLPGAGRDTLRSARLGLQWRY